jgi:acyl-CoA synthetase (AMP-forming)/AMP-acid ligase II
LSLETTLFSTLLETPRHPALDGRFAAVGPDTVAKILFTSGSTGKPKGVLNTQRMLCSNHQVLAQAWPFLEERPPVILDWLPWSHTFGGNHNLNLALRNGGTLYVDGGKPAPASRSSVTVENKDEALGAHRFLWVAVEGGDRVILEVEASDLVGNVSKKEIVMREGGREEAEKK